ncbi:RagB/SusD family nutrient uptake outer membrane protein [Sphingobacterium humi]|uniref:RagB/SusD family nutrient uptake outer membrane protein n=1 Tax=Sphingobacterium humi TaxID=1796905 RepID=A0A6N8L1F8_9SPHI|nr:RagB/SusD family nutrient uptake outer membrane protein [Sphingobacterium humi]MVZ61602.1 RagB/SusD family nutrient uptake outer membrane protein [Sphingobacterium humi]
MMRIYNKMLIGLAVVGFLGSCDKTLDTPPDSRTELDTPEKIQKLLVSAYPRASVYWMNEMASDNTDYNGDQFFAYDRFQVQSFLWQDITEASNDNTYEIWSKHYEAIGTANAALEAIEKLCNPSNLNAARGEALMCRAYSHFVLVNAFSHAYNKTTSETDLGIPYSDKIEKELITKHDRGSVAQTYANIQADIEEALPLVSDSYYTQPKFHFNIKAAYAFAARFYLYHREYDKAIAAANKALGADARADLRNWDALQKMSNNNFIKPNAYINKDEKSNYLLMDAVSSWGYCHGPYKGGGRYSYNKYIADTEATNSSGPWEDYALLNFRTLNYDAQVKKMVSYKIGAYFEYTDIINKIGYVHSVQAIFTADETLLTRAEAYALKGDVDNAAKDMLTFFGNYTIKRNISKQSILNYYKNIAYYKYDVPTPKKAFNIDFTLSEDQENMIHSVLHARRILNMHEGLRWNDVKRYGMVIYRRLVQNNEVGVLDELKPNDHRRAFQLPKEILGAGLAPNPR